MTGFGNRQLWMAGTALAGFAGLAGCAPKPAPAPPPPPVVVVIPPQPMPPRGAAPSLQVPPRDAMGLRQTVNLNISAAQTLWNLRSAYNVAALNCMKPEHAQIVINYRAFLKSHLKGLNAANKAVDSEFKAKYGARFIPPREAYMTQVYNYFALPPTLPAFCDAALAMSNEAATVPTAELETFAARSLPNLERVFLDFYTSFDQYRADLAAWQARYAPHQLAPAPMPASAMTGPGMTGAAPAYVAPVSPAAALQPAPMPTAAPTPQAVSPSR